MLDNKLTSLSEAIGLIQDGDLICLGGQVESRRPVAAMLEMIRQKKRNLISLGSMSIEDILVSAGVIGGMRGCYSHMGIAGKAFGIHRALKEGRLIIDDIGHIDTQMQILGGAYGLPYIASHYCLGSDITNPEFDRSEELRAIARNKDKIPSKKYVFQTNPFTDKEEKIALLPAIRPDVCITHVAMASPSGTCRYNGTSGLDWVAGFAGDKIIITADEIVSEEYLRRDPNRNLMAGNMVTAVVECPWGAHPTINMGYYDLDLPFLQEYREASKTEETYKEWEKKWVWDVGDHFGYIEKLGVNRLQNLKAYQPYGFRPRSPIGEFVPLK